MSASTTAPATIQLRRGHLFVLIAAVTALTAAATLAVSTLAFDSNAIRTGEAAQAPVQTLLLPSSRYLARIVVRPAEAPVQTLLLPSSRYLARIVVRPAEAPVQTLLLPSSRYLARIVVRPAEAPVQTLLLPSSRYLARIVVRPA